LGRPIRRPIRAIKDTKNAQENHLDYICSRYVDGVVPDFWDDNLAYEEFINSFFESLLTIACASKGSRSTVAKQILSKIGNPEELADYSVQQLTEGLQSYLKDNGWNAADWSKIGN
jgi:hypothetical protein